MWFLLIRAAAACGGMMPLVGQVVASDAQQAVIRIGAAQNSVEYRVRYTGSAADFAWVIPVPGGIEAVEEGEEATFTDLEERTGPLVWDAPAEESGCQGGCLASKSGLDGGNGVGSGVVVTGHGFAGNYSYVTLRAGDAEALSGWFEVHGYDASLAAADIAAYVADPIGFEWVAVQVRPDVVQLDEAVVFTPLRIRYGPGVDGVLHATFPARMAHSSTADTDRIELYTFADSLVDVGGGWTAIPANPIEIVDAADAADAYARELERVGTDKRAFVWAWSGEADDPLDGSARFLTRYDTIVLPDTLTTDPVLTETGLKWHQEVTIQVAADGEDQPRTAVALLFVAGLAVSAGRRGSTTPCRSTRSPPSAPGR